MFGSAGFEAAGGSDPQNLHRCLVARQPGPRRANSSQRRIRVATGTATRHQHPHGPPACDTTITDTIGVHDDCPFQTRAAR
jgi:hypothetical protein